MEGPGRKLYFLFVCLVILSITFVFIVSDSRGNFTNFHVSLPRNSGKPPNIKAVGMHSDNWSLVDQGFDFDAASMIGNSGGQTPERKDFEMKMKMSRQKGKKKNRKKNKRKRKKKGRKLKKLMSKKNFDSPDDAPRNNVQSPDLKEDNEGWEQRFPNVIIIGAKKCGTRALLQQLAKHSKIASAGQEIHFFDRYYDRGLNWYREQMPFSQPDELILEKTPAYLITKEAPERVYDMVRKFSLNISLIVIVRDPVERIVSDFAQGLEKKKGKSFRRQSLEERVFESDMRKKVDRDANIVQIGLYAEHLERWLRFFPLSQIHVVSGEKLVTKPWEELKAVQEFLNIPVEITKDNFWYNKTKKFYCVKQRAEGVEPKCLGKTKGRKHPKVDVETLRMLRDFYLPYNKKFYELVKRDFEWPE